MIEAIDANPTGLYETALGEKNRAYYVDKFQKFDREGLGLKVSWNWPAFFFGGIWALYRKMYGWFFGWWFVLTVLTVFKNIPNAAIQLTLATVVLACWLGFAVFANSFYHSKIKVRIANANKANSDASVVDARLRAKSGIHSWVPIVFGAIPVIGIVAAVAIPTLVGKTEGQAATVTHTTDTSSGVTRTQEPNSQRKGDDLGDSVRSAIRNKVIGNNPPVLEFVDTESRLKYLEWKSRNSKRLSSIIPEAFIRQELLQTIWYESKRAGLDPTLVLSVASNLSGFRKFNVDETGARGYVAVGTKWVHKIGDGDVASLFHTQTNLRYGCVLLRHFLDARTGDLYEGLSEYLASNLALNLTDPRVTATVTQILSDGSKWE